jgi:LmbE family N-acetylglucosaminyl deacetylase
MGISCKRRMLSQDCGQASGNAAAQMSAEREEEMEAAARVLAVPLCRL